MTEQRDCKEYSSKMITASEILAKHALELAQLVVVASNGTSDCRIYDGVDTNGEYKIRIRIPSEQTRSFHFNPHIYFRNGLYIEFYQKVTNCFVQYRLRPHGED